MSNMYSDIVLIILTSLTLVYTQSNLDPHNNDDLQYKIVAIHNYFRSKAMPTASNMLGLKWSDEAERMARKHVNKCQYGTHSSDIETKSKTLGQCGENLAFMDVYSKWEWLDAIKMWHDENSNFQYGGDISMIQRNFMKIGHYTALMWATTSHVGCAFAKCMHDTTNQHSDPFFYFVCNYCPTGNYFDFLNKPYIHGPPCNDCPNHCYNSLCLNACPVQNEYSSEYCDISNGKLFEWYPKGCRDRTILRDCAATCQCKNKIYWKGE